RERRHAKILEKFDANGDGELDETDRAAAREAFGGRRGHRGGKRAKILEKFDANGDGKLDEAERAELRKKLQERRG
ncbi:MAG: dockerin type I domain-containing protein, partial [Planctomycetota bacterium]